MHNHILYKEQNNITSEGDQLSGLSYIPAEIKEGKKRFYGINMPASISVDDGTIKVMLYQSIQVNKYSNHMKNKLALAGAILAALLISGCSGTKEQKNDPDTLAVNVVNLGSNSEVNGDRTVYDGTIEADKTIDLSFQVSGTILSFPVLTGDYVKKGQLIGSVDETIYRNQYNMQLAQSTLAEENYTRINDVFKKGSVSEIKMLEAKSNYDQATAAARATYQNIAHTNLYAPASGYIGEKKAEAGSVASPGQPVLQLLDTHSVKVLVAVPENEINQYKAGTPASVKIDALGDVPLQGKVSEVGVLALNGSANYNLKISLTNAGMKLKPGMLCKVVFDKTAYSVSSAQRVKEVIVPVQSVQVDEKGANFLYVLSAGHKAVRKDVTTGQLYSNGIAIQTGLTGNEQVITSGYQKLTDQTPVIVNK